VGPMDNYAGLPEFVKWILSLDMLLGRLEIYTVIILLVPRFYKKYGGIQLTPVATICSIFSYGGLPPDTL